MKLTALTTAILLSTATYAFAGGGAPVPEGAMKDDPSGRPGKILSEAECDKAGRWRVLTAIRCPRTRPRRSC